MTGIGLALLAIWFAGRPPTLGRTFGYLRLEIIAAVANAILLFGVAGYVVFEAVRRLGVGGPLHGDGLDHLATAVERRQRVE